jgi:hypothetical protein
VAVGHPQADQEEDRVDLMAVVVGLEHLVADQEVYQDLVCRRV